MTRQLKIFWIGMLIYAVSFFLLAVGGPGSGPGAPSPFPGIFCAIDAIGLPVDEIVRGTGLFQDQPLALASLLISGCINPVFLLGAFLDLTGQYRKSVAVLRIVLFAMIPFCWMFFHIELLYPREGHYLWVLGMLLVLCSHWLAKARN